MDKISGRDKKNTRKSVWSKEEDQLLITYIQNHGEGNWPSVSKGAGLRRCRKSCRFRWMNYLRPDLKTGNFSQEETELIIRLHSVFGNKWSQIAARVPGRSDNSIKNYWNCHLKRQLLAHGIDPVTHQPLDTAANADPPTNSEVSGVTTASKKNASNNIGSTTKQIYYFNVFLDTKVQVSSGMYSGGDGAGSSSSASGVTVTTAEEVHHPQLNLELSLAPPSQPEDENNSMVPEELKPEGQVLFPGNDVNVYLGL